MISYKETSQELLKRVIQPRRIDAHKGDNGVVAVLGGSRIFHGAPILASMAALRTGADLVYLAVPKMISAPVRALTPNVIVFPLPDGKLTRGSADSFLKWLPEIDSLVLGPGLGRQNLDGAKKIVADVCLERKVRASLDSEAQSTELYSLIKNKDCITTPHPGEFRRVFGEEAGSTLEEKIASVKKKASEFGVTIVLKGHETVISDGRETYVNKIGSPAMTFGGIGDTLSGVIGTLLAQCNGTDVRPIELASAASFAVGSAGQKAAKVRGFHLEATDIIEELPEILKPFDRIA
jgi:ADP-dependent NAD(P)H-hydrate dehydratase